MSLESSVHFHPPLSEETSKMEQRYFALYWELIQTSDKDKYGESEEQGKRFLKGLQVLRSALIFSPLSWMIFSIEKKYPQLSTEPLKY